MTTPADIKRPCVYPSDEMVAWIELAATYERAKLGNDITPQTEQALQQMVTFLTQPAQVYAAVPKAERPSVCPTCGSVNRRIAGGRRTEPCPDPWHGGAE